MTPELTVLALAGLLQVVHYGLFGVAANMQLGVDYALGPRDEGRTLRGIPQRLQRAMSNHFEGLIMFTLAVVVIELSGANSTLTAACAWAYLAARVVYIPAYAYGWVPWRSVIWAVGFLSTVVMIAVALL